MGMNVIPLKELPPDETKEFTLDLLKSLDADDVRNEKSRGQLVVEVRFKPFKEEEMAADHEDPGKAPKGTPAGGGLLVITVHQAQDVEGKHHTNPYVRLLLKGEERKTKVYHLVHPPCKRFECLGCCLFTYANSIALLPLSDPIRVSEVSLVILFSFNPPFSP